MEEPRPQTHEVVTGNWNETVLVTGNCLNRGLCIRDWCNDNGCNAYILRAPEDIIGVPYFASILDHEAPYGDVWYTLYEYDEQLREESEETAEASPDKDTIENNLHQIEPTIIVLGKHSIYGVPDYGNYAFLNPGNDHTKSLLIGMLDFAKKYSRVPETHMDKKNVGFRKVKSSSM